MLIKKIQFVGVEAAYKLISRANLILLSNIIFTVYLFFGLTLNIRNNNVTYVLYCNAMKQTQVHCRLEGCYLSVIIKLSTYSN